MRVETLKYATSSDELFTCYQSYCEDTPKSVLSPALSILRAADGTCIDEFEYGALNVHSIPPLKCPAERFSQRQLFKSLFREKFLANMRSKRSDFFKEKINFASQWQAILEPCIPPTGAQVSVLRRAPN